MKRKICLIVILVVALSASVALGDHHNVQRVPAGAVAFHWVGYYTPPDLVGYIAFIEGVQGDSDGDLFAGTPGEGTAYFTVKLDSGPEDPVPDFFELPTADSDFLVLLIKPGYTWGVFYDKNPDGRDWNDPRTFSKGMRVATFEESAVLGTNIWSTDRTYNLFSSRLIWSKRFRFNGQMVNFRKLVPNGVTINNVAKPFQPAFTASAVAIGGDHNF